MYKKKQQLGREGVDKHRRSLLINIHMYEILGPLEDIRSSRFEQETTTYAE